MARINDVGGTQGFGAIDTTDDTEPFHADWEARVVGLYNTLRAQGIFNTNEFRDTIESMAPHGLSGDLVLRTLVPGDLFAAGAQGRDRAG